jgi:hypothetical protein
VLLVDGVEVLGGGKVGLAPGGRTILRSREDRGVSGGRWSVVVVVVAAVSVGVVGCGARRKVVMGWGRRRGLDTAEKNTRIKR